VIEDALKWGASHIVAAAVKYQQQQQRQAEESETQPKIEAGEGGEGASTQAAVPTKIEGGPPSDVKAMEVDGGAGHAGACVYFFYECFYLSVQVI